MKLNLLAALSIASVCFAQNESQVAVLQESLMKYKAESAEYTARVNKLVVQLKKTDADIESSVSKALEFAQHYTDSVDTHERIMKTKESILRDLLGSVEHYAELRQDINREISKDQNHVKEDMIEIRDWANEKIKLRVRQITEITTSLGGYDYYGSGVAHNDDKTDYEREKRLAENAAESKKDIIGKMRQGVEDLSKRGGELEKELADVRAKRPIKDISTDLTAVNEKIALLENSIEDIYNAEAYGERVGKAEAREIENEMRNRISKIKSSSTSFFKSFDALMHMLRMRKSVDINIEKYEFAIEQLKAGS